MATFRYELMPNGRLVKKVKIFGIWWVTAGYPDTALLEAQAKMKKSIEAFEKAAEAESKELENIKSLKGDVKAYDREQGTRGRPFEDRLGFFKKLMLCLFEPKLPSGVDVSKVQQYQQFALNGGLFKPFERKVKMEPASKQVVAVHSVDDDQARRQRGNNNQQQNNNQRNN